MADEYATHLPVLRGLVELLDLRQVLEFGGGFYSTSLFLSLPKLERLVTVETDSEWRERLAHQHDDERLSVVDEPVDTIDFDLVFIDDGKDSSQREQTIRSVLSAVSCPVVIHDAEVPEYRQAIRELSGGRSMLFCLETPHTALIWPLDWPLSRTALAHEVSLCTS